MMATQINPQDDDMPAEIDFSKGARGKFHKPGMRLNLSVYLDDQVQATLSLVQRGMSLNEGRVSNEE